MLRLGWAKEAERCGKIILGAERCDLSRLWKLPIGKMPIGSVFAFGKVPNIVYNTQYYSRGGVHFPFRRSATFQREGRGEKGGW